MVRIWCLPVNLLDKQRLLGEHKELHTIFNVLTKGLKGFSKHPQTLRFKHHLGMLVDRHGQQVLEMKKRGYNHNSPLVDNPFVSPYTELLPIKHEKYSYSIEEEYEDYVRLLEKWMEDLDKK